MAGWNPQGHQQLPFSGPTASDDKTVRLFRLQHEFTDSQCEVMNSGILNISRLFLGIVVTSKSVILPLYY